MEWDTKILYNDGLCLLHEPQRQEAVGRGHCSGRHSTWQLYMLKLRPYRASADF